MKQQTFSDIEYANRRRKTKREEFLDSMNQIIPWSHWIGLIQPFYYNNKRGRRPKDIEVMLRMYLMQNWFNLSDEGIEEAIYDSYAMRSFLGINFMDEQVPDATTLLKCYPSHYVLQNHLNIHQIKRDTRQKNLMHLASNCSVPVSFVISWFTSPKNKKIAGCTLTKSACYHSSGRVKARFPLPITLSIYHDNRNRPRLQQLFARFL